MRFVALTALFCLVSCTKTTTIPILPLNTSSPAEVSITPKNCSGLYTEMKLLYGYSDPNSGSTFAKILAVDHQDGTMNISVLPPNNGEDFSIPDILKGKSFRLIACPENRSSAFNPSSAIGACQAAPINLLGGADKLTLSANFTNTGGYINGARAYATRNPGTDEGKPLPNFLMLVTTATNDKDSQMNDLIIASGELPYKYCYSTTY
jgi:hypothetical protein